MQLGVLRSFVKHKVGRSIQEYLKKNWHYQILSNVCAHGRVCNELRGHHCIKLIITSLVKFLLIS